MKSTDELKSEIYIHTQGIIDDDVCVDDVRKRGGKMTAGTIISRAHEEMKLPPYLFKISLLIIWQIETWLWRRFFFFFFFFFWGGGGGATLSERVFHCTPV